MFADPKFPSDTPADGRCRAGYSYKWKSCFKLQTDRQTYEDSKTSCLKDGGWLALDKGALFRSYFTVLMGAYDKAVWIGRVSYTSLLFYR